MKHSLLVRSPILCAAIALLIGGTVSTSFAQIAAEAPARAPDVPYVPTPKDVVDKMLQMAKVREGEVVYDLGCGDGRIVITAAKEHGARGVGVDINPQRIEESKANAAKAGVEDKVEFRVEDLFEMKDLNKADVVTLYLLPSVNLKLRPKLLSELDPGKRVVSHAFDMDDWQPDQKEIVEGKQIFYWVIPAQVEGTWNTAADAENKAAIKLKQSFQKLNGSVDFDGTTYAIRDGKVNGADLQFIAAAGENRITFKGKLDGEKMTGALMIGGYKADVTLSKVKS